MIYQALEILKVKLSSHLGLPNDSSDDKVIIGNIALLDTNMNGGSDLHKYIVLTPVKIEEEKTLKNLPNFEVSNLRTVYKNPPVCLNLFLLITTGTHKITTESYQEQSLIYLSQIIQFFQGENHFTPPNTPLVEFSSELNGSLKPDYFELIVDLFSPTFEESNYMWSTLGGRQLPHVCYKVRLVEIQPKLKKGEGLMVEEIELES